ncbi:MAG: conjugal transfer protein TrbL family protein [Eubacteriales bacterium]
MFDWIGDLIDGMGEAIGKALTSLWETISDSIWDIFLKWIYQAIYDAIANFFTMMGNMGADLFNLEIVKATLKLFSLFGWSLFIAGLVVAVFDTAIEYQSMGRINIKRQIMPILYGFLAVNLFTTVPIELYKLCITLQNTFSKDLSALFASQATGPFTFAGAANSALTLLTGIPSVFNLFFMIALGYCVIKIFFSNIKRGGILITQIAVGSLYMFSIPKGYTDGFIQWCKQVIALCLTAFMQMTLLFLGLLTWQTDWLLGIGIMMAANEVPRIAQAYGLDTSVRVNMMSAIHTTTTAVNLTRAIVKK